MSEDFEEKFHQLEEKLESDAEETAEFEDHLKKNEQRSEKSNARFWKMQFAVALLFMCNFVKTMNETMKYHRPVIKKKAEWSLGIVFNMITENVFLVFLLIYTITLWKKAKPISNDDEDEESEELVINNYTFEPRMYEAVRKALVWQTLICITNIWLFGIRIASFINWYSQPTDGYHSTNSTIIF